MQTSRFNFREEYICKKIIDNLQLDLKGLNILTEAASGCYSWTPILSALAGAKVQCLGRDSAHGLFEDNKSKILNLSDKLNINDKIKTISNDPNETQLSEVNIVTNSGLLRPIDNFIISRLNPKAVISLMWETWEFRATDIDLKSAQKHKIPIIGTNEDFIDVHEYNGYYMLKLLFDMKIEVFHNHIVIIGHRPACHCIELFKKMGVSYTWVSSRCEHDSNSHHYDDIDILLNLDHIDAIIFADHESKKQIIGTGTKVTFQDLKAKFPQIRIGHVCGAIDFNELKKSNLFYHPAEIKDVGFMSYQPDEIGAQPVLELFGAGLKVGELAAKARLSGFSLEETIKTTVDYGIGQDFAGGFMNFKG